MINGRQHKYGYNGKEEENELSFGMMDYGARFYDPSLGKWFTADALAEKYYDMSPYNYAMNNPVIYIDPDGNAVEMCCKELWGIVKGVSSTIWEEAKGTYEFVTRDAYQADTYRGLGNMAIGLIASHNTPGFNTSATLAIDDALGTNSTGTMMALADSVNKVGDDLANGNSEQKAAAITSMALMFSPGKLDDVSRIGKLGKLSKVDNVIVNTLNGKGNMTSKVSLNGNEALEAGMKHIGDDYSEIGKAGSGVYRSNVANPDGSFNQFRMDSNSLDGNHAPNVPHVHLEIINPAKKKPVVNNHIPLDEN